MNTSINGATKDLLWLLGFYKGSHRIVAFVLLSIASSVVLEAISLFALYIAVSAVGNKSELVLTVLKHVRDFTAASGLDQMNAPWFFLLAFGLLQGASIFVGFLSGYFSSLLAIGVSVRVRTAVFRHYLHSPFYITSAVRKGEIFAMLEYANSSVTGKIRSAVELISSLIFLVGYLAAILTLSAPFLLASFLFIVFIYLVQKRNQPRLALNTTAMNAIQSDASGYASESFSSIKYIHYSQAQTDVVKSFSQRLNRLETLSRKQAFIRLSIDPLSAAFPLLFIVIVSTLTILGVFSIGIAGFATSLAILLRLSQRVKGVIGSWNGQVESSDGVHRIKTILNASNFPEDFTSKKLQLSDPLDSLYFKLSKFSFAGISASRTDSYTALQDVELQLKKGDAIAIAGKSGSGKSTIIDVLTGLYPGGSSSLLINGKEYGSLTNIKPPQFCVVPQDITLYSGSLRQNITLGKNYSDEDVVKACEMALLSDFLDGLQSGLDTLVGDSGFSISGGQRQRVALARAILSKPNLLILDEATSALDPVTASKIMCNIIGSRRDNISIIVSHQLEVLSCVDYIYFIENGQLTLSGTFDELTKEAAFSNFCNNCS